MSDQPRSISVHIPLTFVALAIAVFFASQIGAATRSVQTMDWQKDNYVKQIKQLEEAEKQVVQLVENRKELVGQSQKVQEQYTVFLRDLLDLAKTDADAAEVVKKFGIQEGAPDAKKEEKKDN